MPVNLKTKKRLVSRIVGVGVNRVRFDNDHLDDVADAITRDDIRSLITANTITIKSFTGTSHGRAQAKRIQKAKRGTKQGSKKGRKGARVDGRGVGHQEHSDHGVRHNGCPAVGDGHTQQDTKQHIQEFNQLPRQGQHEGISEI